jgi:MoxR-like ATPase
MDKASVEVLSAAGKRVLESVERVIVGKSSAVELVIVAILCEGHVLLEDVPGIGKTMLAKAVARSLGCSFRRIQSTPDLLPSDITGTYLYNQQTSNFEFRAGPVFAQTVLADEINRATPKTQSALLEAMQEQTVTVGGTTYRLDPPFIVLATQNPIEMEGTYPLPEAQLDRFFFKLVLGYPTAAEIATIIDRTTAGAPAPLGKILDAEGVGRLKALVREVPLAAHVRDYAISLALASRPGTEASTDLVTKYVRYGASPRGPQALVLAAKANALFDGRLNAGFDDVKAAAHQALRHRVLFNFEGEAEGLTTEQVIDDVLTRTPVGED